MHKKSSKKPSADEIIDEMKAGEVESSLILLLKSNGDRVYLHPFDTDLYALEFLEIMVAGLRCDVFESIMKRSLN